MEMELVEDKSRQAGGEQNKQLNVLRQTPHEEMHGEVLVKIASSFYYCLEEDPIVDLSRDMSLRPDILAVGVVDRDMQIKGIVTRKHLFDILGKPYGRDVMKFKAVDKVAEMVSTFDFLRNIFSVSDEMAQLLQTGETRFFILTENNTRYKAIFSTLDMLVYLSSITQKDIALARHLQHSIVKEELLIPGDTFSIIGATRMAKGVGGDFYSVKRLRDGRWFMSICDVSGKGVAASLITTAISGMFSVFSYSKGSAELVKRVNEYLYNTFEAQKFVTGMFMEFNPVTGECEFFDMGHSYIFISRDNKLFRVKTRNDNLPLGIMPSINPGVDRFKLKKGDVLFLITDGIAEQTNEHKQEYGDQRMRYIIHKHKLNHFDDLKDLKDDLFQDIYEFRGIQPQHDDMTLLFVKYHP